MIVLRIVFHLSLEGVDGFIQAAAGRESDAEAAVHPRIVRARRRQLAQHQDGFTEALMSRADLCERLHGSRVARIGGQHCSVFGRGLVVVACLNQRAGELAMGEPHLFKLGRLPGNERSEMARSLLPADFWATSTVPK